MGTVSSLVSPQMSNADEDRPPYESGGAPERSGGVPERSGGAPERGGRAPERGGGALERSGGAPDQRGAAIQSAPASRWDGEAAARWYVLQTRPREEGRVLHYFGLRRVDAETFLPKIEVRARHARRVWTRLEPLFPGYLFLRFGMEPRIWHAIHRTPGVRQILCTEGRPVPVDDELIGVLRARVAPLGFVRIGVRFRQGDRVRVKRGPFAGLEAIFERPTTRRDRVRVLLELLGARRPLELDVFDLERV